MQKTSFSFSFGCPNVRWGGGRPGWDKIPSFSKKFIWGLPLLLWKQPENVSFNHLSSFLNSHELFVNPSRPEKFKQIWSLLNVLGKCQRMYFLHCHPRIFITYMCIFFCISFCISYIKERQYLLNWIHWYLCSFILFMWYQICPLGGATYIRCLLMTLSLELFEYCSVCSDWITVVFWGIADVHQCFP